MKVGVIGTGYVGLVAGACFADVGNDVVCADHNAEKVAALKAGKIPIFEPGLEEIVHRAVAAGRLKFTTSTEEATRASDIIFMCLNTPSQPDGSVDLRYLKSAAEDVGRAMNGPKIVVNKSTVPLGAHRMVREWIQAFTKFPVEVVSNPEFLKEGAAIQDFLKPDRVVIGSESKDAFERVKALYEPFVRQGNPVFMMDPVSAEMTKYAANAFLATKISFMNELSQLCDRLGADIELVRRGITSDERIGKHFLYAGAGFGGSCFPKDIRALVHTAKSNDVPLTIAEAALTSNERQKRVQYSQLKAEFGDLAGKTVAVWGLAFKPNTDDIREAPALVLLFDLVAAGAKVRAFDPIAMDHVKREFGDKVTFCKTAAEAATGADAVVLVTEWNEFKNPDFDQLKRLMRGRAIFDGRNQYDPDRVVAAGFRYYGIGRGARGETNADG